jgi:3-oxoacyl-[acyl-carrier-protein] synthase-3
MRYESLFVAGLGSRLPRPVPIDEHIADGLYDPEEQDETGQLAVTIAGPDDTQPDMAVRAGRLALERSTLPAESVSLLLHAVTAHNGLDGWNTAAYLHRQILAGGSGLAVEVRQLSNGAMAAIELAAAYLTAGADREAALITSADRFCAPAYDRWRTSWGLVFADGASAAVLSRTGGVARVLSCVTVSDPELEGMHRGSLPFTAAPDPAEYPLDFRARTLDFAQHMGLEETGRRMAAGLRAAVTQAIAEADIKITDADYYVVPGFGRRLLHRECLDPLGIPIDRTTFSWHAQVGHLGAADQFASLTHLSEAGLLEPGQRVLLIGIGGGFNWTCAVLNILERPPWTY